MDGRLRRAFAAWKRPAAALALAALLALAAVPAPAEGGLIGALSSPAAMAAPEPTATPSATPAPTGEAFANGTLRLTLPVGMEPLEGDALAAYVAAAEFDFPGAAEVILAAGDASRGAALTVASIASDADALSAAREAAEALVGDAEAASEVNFGGRAGARFSCAVGDQTYDLYYFSDGSRVVAVGVAGLEAAEVEAMLASLQL